jgi:NAD-dependent SIR2 family protein deacetylase
VPANDAATRLAGALQEATDSGYLVLVLTGAGVSLASGIPTFRGTDAGALWASNVMARATLEHFVRDPVDSWSWYRQRLGHVLGARPNAAHHALAALERWATARAPGTLQLVTQNIDTLHEAAGSRALIKVHGSIDRARCADAACPESLDFAAFDQRPAAAAIPRCAACGAPMRPHVLWFDEHYGSHPSYRWDAVLEACASMMLVVAVGTSFSVGVTELVASAAGRRRAPLFVIDPQASAAVGPGVVAVREKAEELLPEVCALVGATA